MGKGKNSEKRTWVKRRIEVVLAFILIFGVSMIAGMVSYQQEKENVIENFQQTSIQIRDSIISQIEYESFSEICSEDDMDSAIYIELQEKLDSIRVATNARYLYTAQALEDGTYIYVVDGLPPETVDFAEPGTLIEVELFDYMKRSLNGETMMSEDFMDTDWGKICTAYFPISNGADQVYGILCMEFDMEPEVANLNRLVVRFMVISFFASLFLTALVVFFYGRLNYAKNAVQNAYEDANLRLETILDGISGGFKISGNDEKLSFRYVSEGAAEIQGYTVEEFLQASNGNALDNVYSPDAERVRAELEQQFANGDTYSCKYRVVHKDGSLRWIVDNGKRIINENGEILTYSLYQDVSSFEEQNIELLEALQMLEQERKQYRDALIKNCEYCYSFDVTSGEVTSALEQKNGEDLFGSLGLSIPFGFDELHRRWMEVYKPQFMTDAMTELMRREKMIELFEAGERTVEIEYYSPKKEAYIRTTALLSLNEQNGHIRAFIIVNDMTEVRKEEERKKKELLDAKLALEDAYERANRANAAKTDFLSSMSHDIRTPMNAIIGMADIAGAHLDDKERVADCLSKINISSRHLLGLINEVLDMSKIESGKMDLSQEEFSLSELVNDLLVMSRTQIEGKQHELSVSIRNVTHENVIGDSQRLLQAFMNLLSNAIKYTPQGGKIQLSISEKQTNKPKIGCYEFIFEDNGIGMSEEYLSHLFEPFSRADDVRVKRTQGTGLGMAITRNIVQMMNGNIQVESEPGKGTKFTVTVFLRLQSGENGISYEEFKGLSVLVADDERIDCESACEVFKEIGIEGEWVLSGQEAVERIVSRHNEKKDFFAVVLDWQMPGMDGITAAREIRRRAGRKVPVIILSAYDWSDIESQAREAGVDGFISKPLFKSKAVHLFRELLGHETKEEEPVSLSTLSREEFAGKRALLVEDNDLNAEIAGEVLGMLGIETDRAGDGKQALDIMAAVETGYYDIVFMDIQMPVMNGYEATRAIRALPREYTGRVPIIAMTADAFAEDVRAAKDAGMNEHITKPLDLTRLVEALRKWA